MRKEKGEPTPNRVQSSLLELPRCEGGKDRKAGLKEKGEISVACLGNAYSPKILGNDIAVDPI